MEEVKEEKVKVITLCGSLKFKETFMKVAEELEFRGNCVLSVVYPTKMDKDDYTKEEMHLMDKMHKERIKLADAIYVINVDGYIGSSTKKKIEFAKELGKEIIYHEKEKDNV